MASNIASASSSVTPERHFEKKRKVLRACDRCRRKKIRCDGPMNSLVASKCANCEENGFDCTYVESAKRRGPPKGYMEAIEQRAGRLEAILRQIQPDVNWDYTVGPRPDREEFDLADHQESLRRLQIPPWPATKPIKLPTNVSGVPSPPSRVLGPSPWQSYERDPRRPPSTPPDDLEAARIHIAMSQAMNKLDLRETPWRFHGKASVSHLIVQVNEMRFSVTGRNGIDGIKQLKRDEYWMIPEWELVVAQDTVRSLDESIWPSALLARELIDAYFAHVNFHLPLLSKPVFERQYHSGLWRSNHGFAKVCLMVFANGARFVDNPEVYWPRDEALSEEGRDRLRFDRDGTLRYSAGWKYLRTMFSMGHSILQGPTLFDFQCQVLTCCFLLGSAVPHLTYLVSGFGLRAAQEIGIHVRSTLLHADPVERILFNRAFWCLYHIDRLNCAAIGRSVAIQDTDFDADYPIAVDDEYWSGDFVQPAHAGVPKVAAFVHTLKLDHIIGAALRTIYAINKLPEHGADSAAQRSTVVELDSALNAWADAVPDGLRWDPTRADHGLFEQSAVLYVHYYFCQILVHRPFIPSPKKAESVGLPALAICSNAARSICSIVDTVMRRGRGSGLLPGRILTVHFMLPVWIASLVLLISVYTGRQQPSERERTVGDIQKCLAAMKELEVTWRQAGKLTDVLAEFAEGLESLKSSEQSSHGEKRALTPELDLNILEQLQNGELDELWEQLFPQGFS
ncbi:fungal-specific transcription factor domain-domain-containing protein [Kockovaella imperatae]|uniref:Fungal-specific transcription factor domain-domain-containing protein n=1 Tax=Kockovaella imperatae TaxID=4999 RepID=A0A1Y1UR16_9TREE|nr:fungal-specific transcription factor domain-domain-containing protein [Kockovaella imperatae]ORX39924.1 fungal-specific transcription factor domain-domain-containing protein [Kockovaella imperatae]